MKYCALSIIVCFVLIGQIVSARHSNLHEWNQYKRAHGKVYSSPEEDARRFSLFLVAKEKIRQHNANENASYKLGLNQFSDWTRDELDRYKSRNATQHYNQPAESSRQHPFLRSILDEPSPIPSEVDWRKVAGRVTEVKSENINNHVCNCDYAFVASGLLEGQLLVRQPNRTELVSLSAQQQVDCTPDSYGCLGNTVEAVLEYIVSAGGLESEQDYPYVADTLKYCKFSRDKVVLAISGYLQLPQYDDETLKKTVATFGPVATLMQMGDTYEAYKSGIYDDPTCIDPKRNRFVLVVGYGTDTVHGEYWIVKNSWGTSWGEDGYMRVKRGFCIIGNLSSIPTFSD